MPSYQKMKPKMKPLRTFKKRKNNMIYIVAVQSWKLKMLSNLVSRVPDSWLVEIKRDDFHGIPISYVAIKLDGPLPPELEIPILAQFEDLRLCPRCLRYDIEINILPPQNKSGYCLRHRKHRKPKSKEKQNGLKDNNAF